MSKKHIVQLVWYLVAGIIAFALLFSNKLVSELVLLGILIVWATQTLIHIIKLIKGKNSKLTYSSVTFAILLLIIFYILLHLAFCYQLGYPASVHQTENDLSLTSADWIGFLGNYLGFAGALVMAYFVYRQGKIINDFAISEYIPAIGINIIGIKPFRNNNDLDLLQIGPDSKAYYTLFPIPKQGNSFQREECGMLLFSEITNYSKSTLHDLIFCSLEIKEIMSDNVKASYSISNPNDPSNYAVTLFPHNGMKRCFAITDFPDQFGISIMKIVFSSRLQNLTVNVLVSKDPGEEMHFVNI